MAVCSGGFSVHGENERRREKRWRWRGGMDRGELLGESRHEEVARGGSRQAGGVAVRPAGSVAFHRAAWRRGTRKKTPVPLVGRVGWLGRLRPGREVSFLLFFCFSFLLLVLLC